MNDAALIDLLRKQGTIPAPLKHRNPGTLSVCMIVKNEEKNIKAAIESVLPCADEIIVVDTGSTDNTIKIAKGFDKVRVFLDTWTDDFARARNVGLEKVSCAWVMWIDADDRIPAGQAEKINKLKTAELDRYFYFRITNTKNLLPLGSSWFQLRMFPSHPDIRFEGAIHEQAVYGCMKLGLHKLIIDLDIWHTGYDDKEQQAEKAARNLPLFDKTPMEDRGAHWYMHKGDCLYQLRLWDEGIAQYIIAYNMPNLKQSNYDAWIDLPQKIGGGLEHQGKLDEAMKWYDKTCNENISAAYQKASLLHRLGRHTESLDWFLNTINFQEKVSSMPNNANFCKIYAYHHALRLNLGLGKPIEAMKIVELAHKQFPEANFLDERNA